MKTISIITALLFIVKANCTQSQNLLVGLQGCYPLDNSAVNMAATGSALNGTPVNVTGATDRFGNANGAYAFSGTAPCYVSLPHDLRLKSTAVSFSGWVKFNNVNTSQFIAFTQNTCVNYFEGYSFFASKSGSNFKLALVKSGNACSPSTQQVVSANTNLSANVWYHVGFYAGNDSLKIFLNGVSDATPVPSLVSFSYGTGNVFLGGTNIAPYYLPIDGSMDEVRFYNRKLSNTEFYQLYATVPPCSYSLTDGLQGCYPLDCNYVNSAPTATMAPSLDGTGYGVSCDTGHYNVLNTATKFYGATTSYVSLPNDSRIKPTNGVSFSAWVKLDANTAAAQYIVFAKNTCFQFFEGYTLVAVKAGNQIRYQVTKGRSSTAGCGVQGVLNSTGLYNPFVWHHVAFYMDNYFIKLYVDGVLDNTVASTVQLNYDASNVILGGSNQSYNYPLNGSIDNVRFYNKEITAKEIYVLYNFDPACDKAWDPCYNYNTYLEYIENCHRENRMVGLNSEAVANNSIEFYPNPSSGKVYIRHAKNKLLSIYDLNGKLVSYNLSPLDETTDEISLTDHAEGLYFVKVTDADGKALQTAKLIITP
jgi:hypothetical protein